MRALLVLRGERLDGGQMRLEEGLVDLALVDRDVLFDADPDHLCAVDPDLLDSSSGVR